MSLESLWFGIDVNSIMNIIYEVYVYNMPQGSYHCFESQILLVSFDKNTRRMPLFYQFN